MTEENLGLMRLIDMATDYSRWVDELTTDEIESICLDDDPKKQWERRLRESEVAALGAIALLLLRRDDEMWDAWLSY